MLGTTESFINAIERIREELAVAERRHQRLREEFDEFRRKDALNSAGLHNRSLDHHTTD